MTNAKTKVQKTGSVSNEDRPEIIEVVEDKNKALWGRLKSGAGT